MTGNGLVEALRYGSRRSYGRSDLGRYGLGLKTASLSQCRSVTVITCRRSTPGNVHLRMLDLDLIAEWDEWLVVEPPAESVVQRSAERLASEPGTVVIWRKLDRVLPEKRPDGGWARRRLEAMAAKTAEHLGIVFHRYLEGAEGRELVITVNGHKVEPWNPFAPSEPTTNELPLQRFEMSVGDVSGSVTLRRFVLPARDEFSSLEEFERYSGPLKWNRQQGIYIYRADRLVQWGGWNGIRGIDEHTKLARAALEFDTDLDSVFNINVAKMRVTLPPQIRHMLDRPINELCAYADDRYRKASRHADKEHQATPVSPTPRASKESQCSQLAVTLAWRCALPPCRPGSTKRSAVLRLRWETSRPGSPVPSVLMNDSAGSVIGEQDGAALGRRTGARLCERAHIADAYLRSADGRG